MLSFLVSVVASGILIFLGASLLRNHRRNAARWSHVLLALNFAQLLFNVMLQGIGPHLISPLIQLVILLALSVTVDPTLRQERELQRELRELEDREAAERGMLGRDLEGKGFIELNFFNVFWVFIVCSVLGLVLEVIWHMVVVDPGVYQDRAGMLFGPFSPIYGVGAVLMTVALNRFYKANPIIIFVVSAVIGGCFEAFVSWFMQTGFGAVAWDYSGTHHLWLPRSCCSVLPWPHEHSVYAHVGHAGVCVDQILPAAFAFGDQPDPLEDALFAHYYLRHPHGGERGYDASVARLLVRASFGREGGFSG